MTDSSLRPLVGSQVMEDPDRLAGRLIQRAWNRDGLPEIAGGLIALYVSGIFIIQLLLEKRWLGIGVIQVLLVLITPMGYLLPRAVQWARSRWLIERVGYVVTKPASAGMRTGMAIASLSIAVIALIVVGLAIRNHTVLPSQWILAGTGVFSGVLYPVCGRAWRFVFLGAVSAVTGILLGVYDFGFVAGWAILFGITGVLSAISGTVVLLRYLRQTPEAGD